LWSYDQCSKSLLALFSENVDKVVKRLGELEFQLVSFLSKGLVNVVDYDHVDRWR
jgi:hypothetical protein